MIIYKTFKGIKIAALNCKETEIFTISRVRSSSEL